MRDYTDRCMHHRLEQKLEDSFDEALWLTNQNYDSMCLNDNYLYRIPYYSDHSFEFNGGYFPRESSFTVDWEDEGFKKIVRESLAPRITVHVIEPPASCLSVAMHIRRGGHHEYYGLHLDQRRCPPLSFFIEQLRYVCKKFNDKPIYVFVFTDDLNPQELVDELRRSVEGYDVVIDYRPENTSDTSYVLDDFYSIPLFDVLIRSGSNFSFVAGKLGNYILEISPKECSIEGDIVTITEIDMVEKAIGTH